MGRFRKVSVNRAGDYDWLIRLEILRLAVVVFVAVDFLGALDESLCETLPPLPASPLFRTIRASGLSPQVIVWNGKEGPVFLANKLNFCFRVCVANPRVIVATSVNLPRGFDESLLLFLL